MMNRYKKSVSEAVIPKISAGMYAPTMASYTDKDGNHAIIPAGWTVSGEKTEQTIWGKDQGLVIYHIPKWRASATDWTNQKEVEWLKRTYDQFVYVPVSMLEPNGESDCIVNHTETNKFGRRVCKEAQMHSDGFCDPVTPELLKQHRNIQMLGGFFISRYTVSEDRTGRMRSVKGLKPCTFGTIETKNVLARRLKVGQGNTGHMVYGAEHDTMREWVIETGTQTYQQLGAFEIRGNHWFVENSPKGMVETGSREEWKVCNIYDLDGNVHEATQEECHGKHVIRGFMYDDCSGTYHPLARIEVDKNFEEDGVGFRVALSIQI